MKESPYSEKRKKFQYCVTLDDQEFHTWAYNKEGATSNAAYRYAEQEDEEVRHIMWQIKQGEIYCEVQEQIYEVKDGRRCELR